MLLIPAGPRYTLHVRKKLGLSPDARPSLYVRAPSVCTHAATVLAGPHSDTVMEAAHGKPGGSTNMPCALRLVSPSCGYRPSREVLCTVRTAALPGHIPGPGLCFVLSIAIVLYEWRAVNVVQSKATYVQHTAQQRDPRPQLLSLGTPAATDHPIEQSPLAECH